MGVSAGGVPTRTTRPEIPDSGLTDSDGSIATGTISGCCSTTAGGSMFFAARLSTPEGSVRAGSGAVVVTLGLELRIDGYAWRTDASSLVESTAAEIGGP